MTRKAKRWLAAALGVGLCAALALGIAWGIGGHRHAAQAEAMPVPPARKTPAPVVTVALAAPREFVDTTMVSGTVVARDEAMAGVQIDGLRIVELSAEDGDRVQRGQVLARLDRTQLDALVAQNDAAQLRAEAAISQARSQILQIEATHAQASKDLERAKQLGPNVLTQATIDQRLAAARSSEAQVEAARSALAMAEAEKRSREAERRELLVRLDRTEVRAPVAGVVSRRSAKLGAMAMTNGEPLFRLVTDAAYELEAEVPEEALRHLAVGQTAAVALAGDADVAGKVRLIASEVDRASRLGKVRIALPETAPARIGSFATARIEIARRRGIGVPAAAVVRSGTENRVKLVKDGRIESRTVTTGVTNGDATEIANGITQGDTVVVRAAAFLRDGEEVRATPPNGAAAATP